MELYFCTLESNVKAAHTAGRLSTPTPDFGGKRRKLRIWSLEMQTGRYLKGECQPAFSVAFWSSHPLLTRLGGKWPDFCSAECDSQVTKS